MKSISAILCICITSALFSFSSKENPKPDKENWMKAGTTLIYQVDNYGKKYNFEVTIKDLTNGYKFDYHMTDPVNKEGSITIPDSMAFGAKALDDYFTGGNKTLSNSSTVWISKLMYDDLFILGSSTITIDGSTEEFSKMKPATPFYDVKYKDQTLHLDRMTVVAGISDDVDHEMQILYESHFPLILSMNLGWTIKLVEIK